MKRALVYGCFALLLVQSLQAQSPGGQGRVPFGSYSGTGIDSINLYNGNLMLNIGLISQPGRELSTGLQLHYNAQGWKTAEEPIFGNYGYYDGGWRFRNPVGEAALLKNNLLDCEYIPEPGAFHGTFEFWVEWKDSTGALHVYGPEGLEDYSTCDFEEAWTNEMMYGSFLLPSNDEADGSRFRIDLYTWQIETRDGEVISPGYSLTTRNGNFLVFTNGVPDQDTLGRTINSSSEGFTVTDANGTPRTYQLNSTSLSKYNPIDDEWVTIWVIESIDLPNGRSYEFDYAHDQGFLTKVTLPSGGYVEFDYEGGLEDHDIDHNYVVARRVSADGTNEEGWTYERSESSSARTISVTNPEGDVVEHDFSLDTFLETATRWKDSASSDPSQVVLLENGGRTQIETQRGSLRQVSTSGYSYIGSYGLRLTQQDQSDWSPISGSLVPLTRMTYSYLSSYPPVVEIAELKKWDSGSSQYVTQGKTQYFYDEYSLTSTPSSVPNKSSAPFYRRNPTTVRRYSDASNYVEEHFYYDDLGNVVEHVDARGKHTTFSYADNFSDSTNRDSYAFPTLVTNAEGHEAETVYNYDTSLPVSITDARGLETSFEYDLMNRPVTITEPSGRETTTTYTDTAPQKVTQEVTVATGIVAKTETTFDRLGRATQTKRFDPDGNVFADTEYDGNGRISRVSAPYRSGSPVWTETAYDVLGRPVTITNPDSTTVEFEYEDNEVTMTDANGIERHETRNALGQLTKVEEPDPGSSGVLETNYSYYVFGPLYQVTQGAQTRTFTHDWLGRLLEEAHPEWYLGMNQHTATYTHDGGGLITTRTDPRGTVATYTYDDIGRPLTVTYSDSTPDVTYTYDGTNTFGFLTEVEVDGVTASNFQYDNAGQLIEEAVTLNGVSGTFTTSYDYDLGGRLVEITYPSGRVVTRTYDDGSGLASSRVSSLADGTTAATLISSVTDNAAGQVTARTLGSSIAETRSFNSRFQVTGIGAAVGASPTLIDLDYGYTSSSPSWENDGRIRSRVDNLQPEHSVDYTYDEIGRLTAVAAANSSWGVSWTLDRWGNRTAQTPSGLASGRVGSQSIAYSNNKNTGSNWSYDNAGNVTQDGTGGHNYTWDAENRLIQVDSSSIQYAYDAGGRRVKKVAGGVTTYYFYGLVGLMSEFSTSTTLSNVTEAASTDRLEYRVSDPTGTAVLLMDGSGNVKANNRVFPFGEPWSTPSGSGNTEEFTTYQRDSESGLDYAMARYFASRSGRFMSTDPGHAGASLGDPQSWNAYAYVGNDPINLIDPSGRDSLCPDVTKCTISVTTTPDTTITSTIPLPGACIQIVIDRIPLGICNGGFPDRIAETIVVPVPVGPGERNRTTYPKFTLDQCKALRTVLDRERRFGTPQAARMSSNTFGDATLAPFNSSYVPNLKTPAGELDLDWYTDLQGWGVGFEPVVYPVMKTVWTFTRLFGGWSVGNQLPFQDPGERTAVIKSLDGGYKDILTPAYMAQVCPK